MSTTSTRLSHSFAASALAFVVLFLPNGAPASACGDENRQAIAALIKQAESDDPAATTPAIAALRSFGQPALDALCAEYGGNATTNSTEMTMRLGRAIDAVAKQKDAYTSRLFWYTDLSAAIAEAQRTQKPIVSLRLLGNLDDDISCANSRFFRTVLYANTLVSDYLRDHFVLHWQSLRPVPRITIDFGDGRRIERTITGNSIHYVLDSNGELIDAIPGLYGPSGFLRVLQRAEMTANAVRNLTDPNDRLRVICNFHRDGAREIMQHWAADLQSLGISLPMATLNNEADQHGPQAPIPAIQAAPLAITKARAEWPMLGAVTGATNAGSSFDLQLTDQQWMRLAMIHHADAKLDAHSIELVKSKSPIQPAANAGKLSESKRGVEDPFFTVLNTLQQSIAIDSVRNEYMLHRRIHEWLAGGQGQIGIERFNQRVYAELFLTPLNDPWMGLAPSDAYAALDFGGLMNRCK